MLYTVCVAVAFPYAHIVSLPTGVLIEEKELLEIRFEISSN